MNAYIMKEMKSAAITESRTELSSEERQLVLETLRSILESPHFCKSKRYPAFLDFIVRAAIQESFDGLKERTVGIEVFGRPADYDTSTDPVVRIAAGEVRRRMALYFSEHPELPVRIDIPAGSYRAEFHFRPVAEKNPPPAPEALTEIPVDPNANSPHVSLETPQAAAITSAAERERTGKRHWRRPWVVAVVAALLLLVIAGSAWWQIQQQNRGGRDFWWPVLRNDQQALILVGKTNVPKSVVMPANLSLDDVLVTAQVCSVIRAYKNDCTVRPGESERADDLRGKSIIVVGGFNNPWSSRLLAALPYQLQGPTEQGGTRMIIEHSAAGDKPVGIIDHPDSASLARDKDYAVIARFHSDLTQSMAVVIAGLGRMGTASAGQYVSSPERMREIFSRAPKNWKGENFEAVLQVDVIQGTPGHVDVIAARFW